MKQYKSKTIRDPDLSVFFSRLHDDFVKNIRAGIDSYYRYYICFAVLAGSGLRASEVLSLKFKDLYKEKIDKIEFVILSVLGKGSKTREVLLPPKLSKLLFEYESYCKRNYFKTETDLDNSFLIFKTSGGSYAGPYTYRWLHKTLSELQDRYNIKDKFNPHKFRHTYASKIAGLDTLIASQLLGHSKLDTTRIYLHHVNTDLLIESVKQIDDAFEY